MAVRKVNYLHLIKYIVEAPTILLFDEQLIDHLLRVTLDKLTLSKVRMNSIQFLICQVEYQPTIFKYTVGKYIFYNL